MAEKQSILGRITQLAKANINALLDRAEDPEKMLDQLIRDYTNSIADAETAVAQTVGNLRLAERDREEDSKAVAEWGRKAEAASSKADELRAGGDTAQADKFDNLAKMALTKQMQFEDDMKLKLDQLKSRRDQLVARQKTAEAQNKVHDAMGSINVMDPTSELSRWEENIRRQEAQAAGKIELQKDSFESQFEELEKMGQQSEVDARLAALKNKK